MGRNAEHFFSIRYSRGMKFFWRKDFAKSTPILHVSELPQSPKTVSKTYLQVCVPFLQIIDIQVYIQNETLPLSDTVIIL